MRLGGAFPFTTTDINHGSGTITLPSGGMYYPMSGNYWWGPGAQTILQWWNPIQGMWNTIGQPDSGPTSFSTDGSNWRLVNMSGVVSAALISNAGSGGANGIGAVATGVSATFASPGVTGGATALGYPVVGGSVPAPTIVAAGSGFLVVPQVVCDPPPLGGVQATFTCTLNASGGIASVVQVNPGAGYASVPNFYIYPQPNYYTGAPSGGVTAALGAGGPGGLIPGLVDPSMVSQATPAPGFNYQTGTNGGAKLAGNALTGTGTLTAIVMYGYGSLYTGTTIPAVTVTGCGAAAATAIMGLCMTGSSSLVGGAGYGAGAPPNFETSLGLIAATNNNIALLPRAARGVTTVAAGAVNGVVIEDAGFGLQKVPVAAVINTSAIATGQATFTPVLGGVADTSILQAQVSL